MPSSSFTSLENRSTEGRQFVRRIGLHHFAHLRAVAEGLDITQCAARYLGTEHGHEARKAHHQTVDAVRAVARRRGEPWRLVGLAIKTAGAERPTLDAFIATGRILRISTGSIFPSLIFERSRAEARLRSAPGPEHVVPE